MEVIEENGEPAQDVSLMVQGCGDRKEGDQSPFGTQFFNLCTRPFHAAMPVESARRRGRDGLFRLSRLCRTWRLWTVKSVLC